MNKYGYIYKHTNKLNGKSYIGQSTQPETRRFRKTDKTFNGYRSCPALFRALEKYGWDQFETEILVYCADQETLNKCEEQFIKLFNAMAPEGYNTVAYSEGRGVQSESTKVKISEKRKKYYKNLKEPWVPSNKRFHETVNEVECKLCSNCKQLVAVTDFTKHESTWDKLSAYCRPCHATRTALHRQKNPAKKLSDEEIRQSYADRREAMKAGVKAAYDRNPDLKRQSSVRNSKPIIAQNIETGETLEFASALKAKEAGFQNSNVGQAIKYGKPYKGYRWSFKKAI